MSDLIENNPNILGGEPVIKGTRIPVALIYELIDLNYSIEEIQAEYPRLDREVILKLQGEKGGISRSILLERFLWQLLFAWCLLLVSSSIFCFFMEGKSSIDMAFTLWDDRYAKVWMDPMGDVILPQILFYCLFFMITAIIVAIIVSLPWTKQITFGLLFTTAILYLYFIASYGIAQQTFLGGRQGITGWLILELPWISLILFCLTFALGLIGLWILFSFDITKLWNSDKDASRIKNYISWIVMWSLYALLIIGIILSSLALNAGLILVINNINAALIIGMCGCIISISLLLLKKGIFLEVINEKDILKRPREKLLNGRKLNLFTKDGLRDEDISIKNQEHAFNVNPRNRIWRPIRNILNGVLISACLGLVAAMCFMTVPDEWVFNRFFELFPWLILGIFFGVVLMILLPEPSIYFPLSFIHVLATYNDFLNDYGLPFTSEFVIVNGILLGFWIAVLMLYQNLIYRAKDKSRNISLMLIMALSFSLLFLVLNFVDRFQHRGQMIQKVITEFFNLIIPSIIDFSYLVLILSIILWSIDFTWRFYHKRKPKAPSIEQNTSKGRIKRQSKSKNNKKLLKTRVKPLERKKKAISLAIIGVFIFSLVTVEVTYVHGNNIQPLLVRNDEFGIWSVPGVLKVEKSYPLQMPVYAPVMDQIEISAARGEWEGWHLLISPQPSKSIILSDIQLNDFTHAQSSKLIDSSSVEVFLVDYLVDEQPDQLKELPRTVSRKAGEHIDLFCRLRVPRDATSGTYQTSITLTINEKEYPVKISLKVFDFTMPNDRHLKNAFGGGWQTEQWYDELAYLRITQYDMGIPFKEGEQYWWSSNKYKFEFNWTAYDEAFQAQLDRGFTGIRQAYFPKRPDTITNDYEWGQIEKQFLIDVSTHLESKKWIDELGNEHSWVEIPYNYWTDEPPVDRYPSIKEKNDRYHTGTSQLKTLLTEEYREEYPILHDCVDIWCPVIGNFEPSAVEDRHAAGQEYWFYVCVGPTAPYPNLMLWEAGHNPRLLQLICARFNVDGFLYWRMTAGNNTYRAGFDGNGDGQIAFADENTGCPLPSLRLLSYSAGVEDFEYLWLMRITIEKQGMIGPIPSELISRAEDIESRLEQFVGERPQFVSHDVNLLFEFREDLALLLEDLWPYTQKLY